MIDPSKLTEADIGRWVRHIPSGDTGTLKAIGGNLLRIYYKGRSPKGTLTHCASLEFIKFVKCEDCPKNKAGECDFAIDGGSCPEESI
jgi:hypothetical protein